MDPNQSGTGGGNPQDQGGMGGGVPQDPNQGGTGGDAPVETPPAPEPTPAPEQPAEGTGEQGENPTGTPPVV